MLNYSGALSQDLAGKGIRVNAVSPGPIMIEGGAWDNIKQHMTPFYEATLADILSPSICFADADAVDADTEPLCTYDLDAHDKVSYLTSVIMCKLYRTQEGGWHVQAIGDAHKGAAQNYAPIYAAVGDF